MRIQSKAGANFAALDDGAAGEGLAIFLSQSVNDVVRWKIEVFAITMSEELLVGQLFTSPPNATRPLGQLTRQVGAAVCPGAISWKVIASPSDDSSVTSNEVAALSLISSKAWPGFQGVSRPGERYVYRAGNTGSLQLLPGQDLARLTLTGTGAGSLNFPTTGSIDGITVLSGQTITLEPKGLVNYGPLLSFTNCNWIAEILESA